MKEVYEPVLEELVDYGVEFKETEIVINDQLFGYSKLLVTALGVLLALNYLIK